MVEFNFSEKINQQKKNLMLIVPLLGIGLSYVWLVFFSQHRCISSKYLFYYLIPIILVFVVNFILTQLFFKNLQKIKVLISDEKIVKQRGNRQQEAIWGEIIKMKVRENIKGKIASLTLYQKDKEIIRLFGYDEMDKMFTLIKEKISGNVLIQTKREKPIHYVIAILASLLILAVIPVMWKSRIYAEFFLASFFLCFGIVSLWSRPMSRIYLRSKWIDIFFGIFLTAYGIWNLVTFFASLHFNK